MSHHLFLTIGEMKLMRQFATLIVTMLLVVLMSACTVGQPADSQPTDSTAESGEHAGHTMPENSDVPFDATFIDGMIEHHQGAIEMAEQAIENAEHQEIQTLAEAIIAAQTTEIEQLESWRTEWFPDLAATEGMAMDMGAMGLSTDESIPYDQRFLQAMISHHEGAVEMAEMALEMSEREEVRSSAEAIIATQSSEIEQMRGWLSEWYNITE
jgi:uncharacterized protein (DUF305 family)